MELTFSVSRSGEVGSFTGQKENPAQHFIGEGPGRPAGCAGRRGSRPASVSRPSGRPAVVGRPARVSEKTARLPAGRSTHPAVRSADRFFGSCGRGWLPTTAMYLLYLEFVFYALRGQGFCPTWIGDENGVSRSYSSRQPETDHNFPS